MGTTLGNLKNKRRQPNARALKKSSNYTGAYRNQVIVGGARTKTDAGYIVPGFAGKSFETYFEHMEEGSSSPVYKHEKKDKVIRVLSGILYVILTDDKLTHQIKAIPGDEVVLERGTSYRLATSNENVEMFVCQNAKYAATLETVDESAGVGVDVPDFLLQEPTLLDRVRGSLPHTVGSSRKGSKAKEQLAAIRASGEGRSPQIQTPQKTIPSSNVYGSNPKPSLGNFDPDGAG